MELLVVPSFFIFGLVTLVQVFMGEPLFPTLFYTALALPVCLYLYHLMDGIW